MATAFYDLGDVNRASIIVTDQNGNPANAGAVVLTVTLPDLTTSTPSITNSSTGNYYADITIAQYGHYKLDWVATGANASAFSDTFDAVQWASLVSLAEAKAELNLSDTSQDEELRHLLVAATEMIEGYTRRRFAPRTLTQTFNGWDVSDYIQLPDGTQTVTAVTEFGNSLTFGSWTFDAATARLYKMWGQLVSGLWQYGVQNITVTYTIGSSTVPSDVRYAALQLITHLWEPQRGGVSVSGLATEPAEGQQYLMPLLVREVLDRYRRKVGMLKVS